MTNLPKILVASPTAKSKGYCFDEWLDNVMGFTYPNFDVRLFDNTQDKGVNAKELIELYKSKYGNNEMFKCENSLVINKVKKLDSIIERMVISHQNCADYALNNGYDYLLHLESDIFPTPDIIEQLLFQKKQVVGAIYFRDEGISRRAMVQTLHVTGKFILGLDLEPKDSSYFDGEVKKVFHVGLGCVLISKKVLQKIKFRSVKGKNQHPDSFFAEDCATNNFSIFAHTGCVARHDNKAWGIYGVDFK
jgi:hypothetical protein